MSYISKFNKETSHHLQYAWVMKLEIVFKLNYNIFIILINITHAGNKGLVYVM